MEPPVMVHLSHMATFSRVSVLTEEKAMQSLTAWQYLTTVPCAHAGSYLAAAESVLCYHLSHLPGELISSQNSYSLENTMKHFFYASPTPPHPTSTLIPVEDKQFGLAFKFSSSPFDTKGGWN